MRPSQLAIAYLLALAAPGAAAQKNAGAAFPRRERQARRHLQGGDLTRFDVPGQEEAILITDFPTISPPDEPAAAIEGDGSMSLGLEQAEFGRFEIPDVTTTLPTEASVEDLAAAFDEGSMSMSLPVEEIGTTTAATTAASTTTASPQAKAFKQHSLFMQVDASSNGAGATIAESPGRMFAKAAKPPREKSTKAPSEEKAPRTKAGKNRKLHTIDGSQRRHLRVLQLDESLSMAGTEEAMDFGRFDVPLPTEETEATVADATALPALPTDVVVDLLDADDGNHDSKSGKETRKIQVEKRKRLKRKKRRAGRNGWRKLTEESLSLSLSMPDEEFPAIALKGDEESLEGFNVEASSNGEGETKTNARKRGKAGKEDEESAASEKSASSEKSEKSAKSSSEDEESESSTSSEDKSARGKAGKARRRKLTAASLSLSLSMPDEEFPAIALKGDAFNVEAASNGEGEMTSNTRKRGKGRKNDEESVPSEKSAGSGKSAGSEKSAKSARGKAGKADRRTMLRM